MMVGTVELGSIDTDDGVDEEIIACLNPDAPRSFFLYAGAGSGKTRSLVLGLKAFRRRHAIRFHKSGQKIAVITYTNAACDEISSRVDDDPLFTISTIHSFCWSQIGTFHSDIQDWLKSSLPAEIAELGEKEAKGRAGTKASIDRQSSIAAKTKRLEWLATPRRFTYNPNGDNFGAASLSHSEVIKITAEFISSKPSMQVILINRFPFLLIDESQDTNKLLIDAVFALEEAHQERFAVGLFGDMMQRIYTDGKTDLGRDIPDRWATPVKKMNHRCPQRVISLANALRAPVDAHVQWARCDSEIGVVRLFVADAGTQDKLTLEANVRSRIVALTGDDAWDDASDTVKNLALEHRMSALRMGFLDMFVPLYEDTRLRTGLLDGTLPAIRLFAERVQPMLDAQRDDYAMMAHLREKKSPLLKREVLKEPADSSDPLAAVRSAVAAVMDLNAMHTNTTFLNVLQCVAQHRLFVVPDSLIPFIDVIDENNLEMEEDVTDDEDDESTSSLSSWRAFLETPYRQIDAYARYLDETGPFDTHQGVKGREFHHVLVVMDDSEARGFSFSYEKLFGAAGPSKSGARKPDGGKETIEDRTRRLFYVTCTRAENSLALLAYTENADRLIDSIVSDGWFDEREIVRL